MELEKSRNGFYTLTFINKNNLDIDDIFKEFSTVGNVCKIVNNYNRVFIRFKEKDEAQRALKKYGKVYEMDMAKNRSSDNQGSEAGFNHHYKAHNNITSNSAASVSTTEKFDLGSANSSNGMYHLILGNLPKNYTIKDVRALVEEAKPVCINGFDETRVFNIKFCHIVLSSLESLNYLIDKLNGFVICGEKLIAVNSKQLIEWKEKAA